MDILLNAAEAQAQAAVEKRPAHAHAHAHTRHRGRMSIHSLLSDATDDDVSYPSPTSVAPTPPTHAQPLPCFALPPTQARPPAHARRAYVAPAPGSPRAHARAYGEHSSSSSSASNSSSQHSSIDKRTHGHIAPRRRWKPDEDALLTIVVRTHGAGRWNRLAEAFPGRNGRQVRLRWVNHLQPSLDKRSWRAEEDATLLRWHAALGNKWALIAAHLNGRSDNSVKNRYKSLARRRSTGRTGINRADSPTAAGE